MLFIHFTSLQRARCFFFLISAILQRAQYCLKGLLHFIFDRNIFFFPISPLLFSPNEKQQVPRSRFRKSKIVIEIFFFFLRECQKLLRSVTFFLSLSLCLFSTLPPKSLWRNDALRWFLRYGLIIYVVDDLLLFFLYIYSFFFP